MKIYGTKPKSPLESMFLIFYRIEIQPSPIGRVGTAGKQCFPSRWVRGAVALEQAWTSDLIATKNFGTKPKRD
jgi:hypothetical protein